MKYDSLFIQSLVGLLRFEKIRIKILQVCWKGAGN